MTLSRIAVAIGMVLAVCAAGYAADDETRTSNICAVTRPDGGVFANDSLEVVLAGKYVFRPGGPGFVDDDGALGIKIGWGLRKRGTLVVTGRRLDGEAPPARAYINHSYDDYMGGMGLYLVFPTPGCWEITGSLKESSLTFVVAVEKIGDGPISRMHGPPPDARVTGGRPRQARAQ
jgi:hypothetical protein